MAEEAEGDVVEEGAEHVRQREGHVAAERRIEGVEPALLVGVLAGLDLLVEIGMRAQRALREGDERARQDVGALDRDADRHRLVGGLQVVGRPVADARGRRAGPWRR